MKTIFIYLTFLLFLFAGNNAVAQDLVMAGGISRNMVNSPNETEKKRTFEFYAFSQNEKLEKIDAQIVEEHFLGTTIARKMHLFNESYTFKTPISPGNPSMKTSIRKPVIYTAVKKIEKQLKKDLKNNLVTTESASALFNKVIEVAMSVINDNTDEFENEVKGSGTPELLLELFTNRVKLNYLD